MLEVDCPICAPRAPASRCRYCQGRGTTEVRRCPHSLVSIESAEICDAAALIDSGVLPAAGGWADQSATAWDAIKLVLAERAAYEEAERRRVEREAERKRKRGR